MLYPPCTTRDAGKPARGSRKDRAWIAAAMGVWAVLILGLAVFGFLYPWSHTVYDIYARACRHWWGGQDMYHARGTDFYRYSPLFAISLTPCALLPDCWGSALWRLFNGLLYAAALGAWTRGAVPAACSRTERAVLFLLVLPLSVHSLQIGQANVVMLAALLFGVTAASAEKWNQAACWLAVATLIKGYPLALALVVIALFPRRFLARYALVLTLGLLLPFAAQRPDFVLGQYQSWLEHLRASTVLMRERLRTVEHLFSIYGYPLSPSTYLLIQLLAGLGILSLCLFQASGRKGSGVFSVEGSESIPGAIMGLRWQLHGAFQLFTCWVVMFGPATESCTYIIIAPAAAWTLITAFHDRIAWTRRVLLLVSFLMMGPLTTDAAPSAIRDFANEHGSQPLGGVLFAGCLLVEMARSYRFCYAEKQRQHAVPKNAA